MEYDDKIQNGKNSYTTEFRQYDPRLGRWKSLDPLMSMFPHMSPFNAFANNPIVFTDPYGLAPTNDGGGEPIKTQNYDNLDITVSAGMSDDEIYALKLKNIRGEMNGRSTGSTAWIDYMQRNYGTSTGFQQIQRMHKNDEIDDMDYRAYRKHVSDDAHLDYRSAYELEPGEWKRKHDEAILENASQHMKWAGVMVVSVAAIVTAPVTIPFLIEAAPVAYQVARPYVVRGGRSAILNLSVQGTYQYATGGDMGDVDVVGVGSAFVAGQFINPWIGSSIGGALDGAFDYTANDGLGIVVRDKTVVVSLVDASVGTLGNYLGAKSLIPGVTNNGAPNWILEGYSDLITIPLNNNIQKKIK